VIDEAYLRDLFAGVGALTIRRMFGGAGVYVDGVMFAAIMDGALHIKTDETLAAELKQLGSRPFIFTASRGPNAGRPVEMSYWRLPETAFDDPEDATSWGRRALAVARKKAKLPKKAATKRR